MFSDYEYKRRDDWLVRIANFFLRLTSEKYQASLRKTINYGFAAMDAELARMEADVVDSQEEQEPLIPADDVDTTAKYVSHPTWRLFGDDLHRED